MLKLVTKEVKHVVEYMGAKFDVVPMTKEEIKNLIEEHTSFKKVQKTKSSKPEYVEKTDFLAIMVDKIDKQVRGWSGISGNPECNSENKRALAIRKENEHICQYILEEIENIGSAIEEEKENQVKN